jgi:hypothetical protein
MHRKIGRFLADKTISLDEASEKNDLIDMVLQPSKSN